MPKSLGQLMTETIANINSMEIHVCAANEYDSTTLVPTIEHPNEHTFYLVPDGSSTDLYTEWVRIGSSWEKFGAARVDLSGKADKNNTILTGSLSLGRKANTTIGTNSVAVGDNVTASGLNSFSEGNNTIATGDYSHAEGNSTSAFETCSHAEGGGTIASGAYQHVSGKFNISDATYAEIIGNGTGDNSRSNARTLDWSGNETLSGGLVVTSTIRNNSCGASGSRSISFGIGNYANGAQSAAFGAGNTAQGDYSFVAGAGNIASGVQSVALGTKTRANGPQSFAEGYGGTYTLNGTTYTSEAKGTADHTEGYQTRTANGQPGNHAEGYQTAAIGGASHAEGSQTIASGIQSHAEGFQTIASGGQTHTEGFQTTASGNQAHAEGSSTTASGAQSHAEGGATIASGASSHVQGAFNIATATYPDWTANTEYVIGDKVQNQYHYGYKCIVANNDATFTTANWEQLPSNSDIQFIIGNGIDQNSRSNAFAVYWNGDTKTAGDVYVGCNNDSTGGNKVATEAYVNARIPAPPSTDGTYTLQVTIADGEATYAWV